MDRLIACTWVTDGYLDLALEQTENLARFNIEHVIIRDPISQQDHDTPTFINKHPFIVTKDRAQCDFLRSLPARYSRVLFLDAEIRLHQPIPDHWNRTVLWHNNPVWLSGRSRYMKRINVGQMIWHREDENLFRDSISFALNELPGYDIEMAIDAIIGDDIQIEFLRGVWFPKLYQGYSAARDHRDYANSQGLDRYNPRIVGTMAFLDTKTATAGYSRYDESIILTHPPLYRKKLEILHEHNDREIMSMFIEHFLVAVSNNDTIAAWKLFHWFNKGSTGGDLAATDVGDLVSCWPQNIDPIYQGHLGHHRVYRYKEWLLCPSLSLAAPADHWNKPFLIENEFGFRSELLDMPSMIGGADTDLTKHHHIV